MSMFHQLIRTFCFVLVAAFGAGSALAMTLAISDFQYTQRVQHQTEQAVDIGFAARASPLTAGNVAAAGDVSVMYGGAFALHGQETVAALFDFNADLHATNRGFGSTDAVTVSGTRAIDKAVSYENGVRSQYTGARFSERQFSAVVDGRRVNGVADDVTIVGGKPTAVEAKFTENWATSPRNPESSVANLPFAVAERNQMITQARNYSAGFRGGAVYHTNSTGLATHYTRAFNDAGITNFKFVITPTQ